MSARVARRAGAVIALTTATTLAATSAMADPALETETVEVEVDDQGTAHVEAGFVVSGGTETLTFAGLSFGSTTIDDVVVSTGDGQSLDTTVETVELKTTATVTLPAAPEQGADIELRLSYTVPGAGTADGDKLTVETPVMTPAIPASTTASGLFTASVVLPPGYRYVEGFPANPDQVDSGGDRTSIHYDVPSPTALLRVVSTSGDAPLLTLERGVTLALVVALLLGGGVLYLSFTRGRRRAAELGLGQPVSAARPGGSERRL